MGVGPESLGTHRSKDGLISNPGIALKEECDSFQPERMTSHFCAGAQQKDLT